MNYLVNLEGLSKIEIIKYIYIQLKHIYPEKIQFYINIFYLPNELIYYIFDYLISNEICSICKIVYLHLYNKNLIPYYYEEYMNYFNKEWTIFINNKLKEKYINLYNDYLSFNKKTNKKTKNIYFYLNKITNQQRKKIKEIFETCNCCTRHKYYIVNLNDEYTQNEYYYDYISLYSRCKCPCREIIEIIEIIEEDIYYTKMELKFNKMYKNNNNEYENKYLKISKLLSNKSYEYLHIDELNEDEWIYYHPITQEKIQ